MQTGRSVCRRGSWQARESLCFFAFYTNQRRGQKLSPLYVEKDFLCCQFATALNKCVAARRIGEPPARVPQTKQSTELFGFPSCAFYGKGISRPAGRDEGAAPRPRRLPPRRAKTFVRDFLDRLCRLSAARAFALAAFYFIQELFRTLLTKSREKGRIPLP